MDRVLEILNEKKMTKTAFAELVGIKNQNVNAMLKNPTRETYEKIASALDVPVWRLFVSPDEVTGRELTALVECGEDYYRAHTVEELSAIVEELKKKVTHE